MNKNDVNGLSSAMLGSAIATVVVWMLTEFAGVTVPEKVAGAFEIIALGLIVFGVQKTWRRFGGLPGKQGTGHGGAP